jgi:hypothetical protein
MTFVGFVWITLSGLSSQRSRATFVLVTQCLTNTIVAGCCPVAFSTSRRVMSVSLSSSVAVLQPGVNVHAGTVSSIVAKELAPHRGDSRPFSILAGSAPMSEPMRSSWPEQTQFISPHGQERHGILLSQEGACSSFLPILLHHVKWHQISICVRHSTTASHVRHRVVFAMRKE